MAQDAYILEKTEEKAVFKAFSEIADALVMKYENLLDEKTYSVTRAKLVLRTYYDDQQELAAEPVWYFGNCGQRRQYGDRFDTCCDRAGNLSGLKAARRSAVKILEDTWRRISAG